MKVLFIGGTGTISTAITQLCAEKGIDLTLLNRGNRQSDVPKGIKTITCDISDENAAAKLLEGSYYDVVADFIAFTSDQIERDIRLFSGKTSQYIFISSASAYQKPLSNWKINESTPMHNPYWGYSQNKIACEERLMEEYRKNGFPVTIIRPSHTYSDNAVPMGIHGSKGSWQVLQRMLDGKPVIVHGDGLSLWAFMHNTDFAPAFLGIMDNPHALGEAIQITADESITWNLAHEIIAKKLGVKPKLAHISSHALEAEDPRMKGSLIGDKANSLIFDNSKLKSLVPGFVPKLRFDEGMERVIANVLAHPELQQLDPEYDAWSDKMIEKYCPQIFIP